MPSVVRYCSMATVIGASVSSIFNPMTNQMPATTTKNADAIDAIAAQLGLPNASIFSTIGSIAECNRASDVSANWSIFAPIATLVACDHTTRLIRQRCAELAHHQQTLVVADQGGL
jgi:hypothetical protein